jgi:hypothetical protein
MVGIVSDEDDDAEAAQPGKEPKNAKQVKPALKTIPATSIAELEPKKLNKAQKTQADRVMKIRQIFTLSAKLGDNPEDMKAAIGNLIGLDRPIKESAEIKDSDLDMIINAFSKELEP